MLSYPSKEANQKLEDGEKRRLTEQRDRLGAAGLAAAGERVKAAVASQILPPTEVLESIPVADINKIVYRSIESYNTTTAAQPQGEQT